MYSVVVTYRALLFSGRAEEALKLVMAHLPLPYLQTLSLAYMGRDKDAEDMLEKYVVNRPRIGT
jgi:hypothetical protein